MGSYQADLLPPPDRAERGKEVPLRNCWHSGTREQVFGGDFHGF